MWLVCLFFVSFLLGRLSYRGGCFFGGNEMSDAGDARFTFADLSVTLFVDFPGPTYPDFFRLPPIVTPLVSIEFFDC
jgi:hypothetical protein